MNIAIKLRIDGDSMGRRRRSSRCIRQLSSYGYLNHMNEIADLYSDLWH